MRQNAYRVGRDMVWSRSAAHYLRSFATARTVYADTQRRTLLVRTLAEAPMHLPTLNLNHVRRMSDPTGMMQHALYSVPNYSHGYCTDDNARALMLTLLWTQLGETQRVISALTTTYTAFLAHAFNPDQRRFLNFMSYDRRWLETQGSEDSHGRALWALGVCVRRSRLPPPGGPIVCRRAAHDHRPGASPHLGLRPAWYPRIPDTLSRRRCRQPDSNRIGGTLDDPLCGARPGRLAVVG